MSLAADTINPLVENRIGTRYRKAAARFVKSPAGFQLEVERVSFVDERVGGSGRFLGDVRCGVAEMRERATLRVIIFSVSWICSLLATCTLKVVINLASEETKDHLAIYLFNPLSVK